MKLLRTIRLDPSDSFIYARAAEPGEWAISGAFVFANADPARLAGKALAAFRGGFLGVPSLGWSTLVQIVEVDAAQQAAAVACVAAALLAHFGAPDAAAAEDAAREEIAFAASLCDHPKDTLVAVHRRFGDGAICESFRTLHARGDVKRLPVLSFREAEEEAPDESFDIADLARGDGR
jgi:drug/metabolite transporter superfamily protein YnfA